MFPAAPLPAFFIEPVNQILGIGKKHSISCSDGIHADPCGDHTFPDTGRTDNDDILTSINEIQPSEFRDLIPVQ